MKPGFQIQKHVSKKRYKSFKNFHVLQVIIKHLVNPTNFSRKHIFTFPFPFCILQLWYALSKTLAEDAAVKFCKEKGLELVAINPGYVIGPILQPTLNLTSEGIMGMIESGNCILQLIFICIINSFL